ncbi:glycosyltransferase [Winogradskyella sp. MH6]|uniref:glycosyltransferase n=1 Tax=Winogradskyella sp. MH6 TaxID=2929510 RepID=UPI001FB5013E|nr:glycosyltransferase [Winogradskyella sp. MH6]
MNKKKIKVYFVLPTLFAGGAERVITFISQNISKEIFTVKLIVIGFEKDSKYNTNEITTIYLNKNKVSESIIPLYKVLKKESPDIVLSSISHLNSFMGYMSIFFKNTKFIGRQATINKVARKHKAQKNKILSIILSKIFNYGTIKLDVIICQSMDMKADFLESYNYDEKKIKVINNPLTDTDKVKTIRNKNSIKKLITVGRLSKIKGQLRLLDILSKLDFPFKFTIIGSGSYEDKIYAKIKELNLEDKINHIKYTDKVLEELIKHDMFLQGSYSEGFPNALLESCAVGVPVIAFNAPGGTKEIIENNINGYIVESEEDYISKLKEDKIWDPKIVRDSVYKKFNSEKILKKYEDLFIEIAKR